MVTLHGLHTVKHLLTVKHITELQIVTSIRHHSVKLELGGTGRQYSS